MRQKASKEARKAKDNPKGKRQDARETGAASKIQEGPKARVKRQISQKQEPNGKNQNAREATGERQGGRGARGKRQETKGDIDRRLGKRQEARAARGKWQEARGERKKRSVRSRESWAEISKKYICNFVQLSTANLARGGAMFLNLNLLSDEKMLAFVAPYTQHTLITLRNRHMRRKWRTRGLKKGGQQPRRGKGHHTLLS
jgi:hypothetical protein